MRVSIIVPNYNGGKLFKNCIKSLLELEYPTADLEIIIVDDGSEDNSQKWLQSLKLPGHFQLILLSNNQGRASARNSGIKKSSGDIIIFLDGDLSVTPNFVLEHVNSFKSKFTIAISGKVDLHPSLPKSKITRYLYDYMGRGARQFGEKQNIPFQFLLTNNMSIRREALPRNGFSTDYIGYGGEDTDFAYQVYSKYPVGIYFSKKAVALDFDSPNIGTLTDKFYHYGKVNLPKLLKKYPELVRVLHADWGVGIKKYFGMLIFNRLGFKIAKTTLLFVPYPLSNYIVRYLLGCSVIIGLRNSKNN